MKDNFNIDRKVIYPIWNAMKRRCFCEKDSHYNSYGGKGVRVCKEWLVFENFFLWVTQSGYKKGLSIDRINNNGGYEPSNCKWSTRSEQQNNTSRNVKITFNSETLTKRQWELKLGFPEALVYQRINKYGWSIEKALTTPFIKNPPKKFLTQSDILNIKTLLLNGVSVSKVSQKTKWSKSTIERIKKM